MTQSFDAAMAAWGASRPLLPVGVAYSGGADSTALLHATHKQWPGQVVALHVNHNLQAAAPLFEKHCRSTCAALNIPIRVLQVDASPKNGISPEDAARTARYQALCHLALMDTAQPAIQTIAIAQHANDQLETVLLAWSRGAGLAGLCGMAPLWSREGIGFCRPLLQVSGVEVRSWLALQQITFFDDPTNEDRRFLRNRIRYELVPALKGAFPHIVDTVARSAQHAAQAQGLLDELALEDAQTLVDLDKQGMRIKPLQALSVARQANVLRWWLKSVFSVIPTAAQLSELLSQVAACRTRGHQIQLKVGEGFVRRNGAVLHWYNL